jgi:hypothetical protein
MKESKFKVGDRVKVIGGKYIHLLGERGTVKGFFNDNVLVELDKNIKGHDGNGYGGEKAKNGHGWFMNICDLDTALLNKKIVITTDGKTTVATLYDGDKVVKEAKADCSPEDKFDFTQGAKLAFERLTHVFKFEVGKQYQYGDLVIEITNAKQLDHDNYYNYKVIKGISFTAHYFNEQSFFAQKLKPYEPPQVYNGKVICIRTDYPHVWTVGKIYEVVNGKMYNDFGRVYPSRDGEVYTSAEDVRHAGNDGVSTKHNCKNEFIPLVE